MSWTICSDVTYTTNNELGFEYLLDNMKFYSSELVMLHFNYAIIDEVDIILIDEARTPLIITWAAGDSSDTYVSLNAIIPYLSVVDYEIDKNNVQLFLQKLRMNIYNNSYKELDYWSRIEIYTIYKTWPLYSC